MKYFTKYESEDDLKKQYYKLAMHHHPDKAGLDATEEDIKARTETMQKINDEFKTCVSRFRLTGGKSYSPHGYGATSFDTSDIDEFIKNFMNSPAGRVAIAGLFGIAFYNAFSSAFNRKKNA